MPEILPVILSGGTGTRLWPLSRDLHPKQFLDITGESFFGLTLVRAMSLPNSSSPMIICNEEHRFLAAAICQDEASKLPSGREKKIRIMLEPMGRNTAPAITMAALAATEDGNDPVLLVLSSDHIITPFNKFLASVETAFQGALQDKLVVFGVPPTKPETGYGYILQGREFMPGIFSLEKFIEKPPFDKAVQMLEDGGYTWNSGMFMFKASVFLKEIERYQPEILNACKKVWKKRYEDLGFIKFEKELFQSCPAISVDYAVMERTNKACMVPFQAEWRDMGSWRSFYETGKKDGSGNVIVGDALQMKCSDCYLQSTHRLVTGLGLKNITVVETADAVLVADADKSQDVKLIADMLKKQERAEASIPSKVHRPWGTYEPIANGEKFQTKRITVKPGSSISLQLHNHRSEHWIVVSGTAKVTLEDEIRILGANMSIYIPMGQKHRLENPGDTDTVIIEVQTGEYIGEDDIVRFEDLYGRTD